VRADRGLLVFAGQTLAIVAVGVLAGLLLWNLTHQPPAPRVGQRAPAFSLDRLNGSGKVALASLRGNAVVLNFFQSTCEPCKLEAPVLEKVWEHYRSQGVIVLGIDTKDVAGDARRFLSAHGVTYPAVGVAGDGMIGAYGIPGFPTTYVLNRQGRIVGGEIAGTVTDPTLAGELNRYIHAALES
jgi:cytochrome c biogenesis protein CcmG/thiol:disulfide interchange protein DsbE